jgi:hypothetical protein
MAYASSPLMLAIDRRIFDIPLEERLQARASDLDAWTKTMLPIIRLSISEAQNQIQTGHQDISTYFSDTAEPERNMNATLATATATTDTTNIDRIGPRRTDFRQRYQQTRNQPATISTNIRRSRHHDICNYLSGATAAVTTKHSMQNNTEEPITPTDNIFSGCRARALLNRIQPPRAQVTQATTEDPTTVTVNLLSPLRALCNRFQHPRSHETQATTGEPITSTVSTFSRLRALRNRFQQARTQPNTIATDTWRFFLAVPIKSNGVRSTN